MSQFETGFALLIGVDENSVPEWSLPPVAKDMAAMEQVLTHPERCAYLQEHVKAITGIKATRQGILDGLEWLQERLQEDRSGNATAIIHYSGHGWRDETVQPPNYYLIPYDVRRDNLRSRAMRAEDFADAVKALNPRRLLVILDCCHAGGMDVKDLKPGVDFLEAAVLPDLLMSGEQVVPASEGMRGLERLEQGHGRAVLSSSQGEQPSYNRRDGQMGIFTYHLIEALTGHAQPQEGAEEVLVSDVMSYVWRCVPQSAKADWGRDQQPDYQVSGNFPVALLLGGKGLASGQQPPDPASLFEDADIVQLAQGGDITTGVKIVGRIGNVGSGSIVGIGSNFTQRVENVAPEQPDNSQKELQALLDGLECKVEALDLPPRHKSDAAYNLEQVKNELMKESGPPDLRRLRVAVDWLCDYVPDLRGTLAGLFAQPRVRRTVAESGEIASEWLKERFEGGSNE